MTDRRADQWEAQSIHSDMAHQARMQLLDAVTSARVAEFFKALGDPTRVRMISALSAGELRVCDLAATLEMTQSAVSHQLRLLRQLRLVKRRRAGQMVFYAIDDEHVSMLFHQGIDHVRHG